jgi:hypothetical protein
VEVDKSFFAACFPADTSFIIAACRSVVQPGSA